MIQQSGGAIPQSSLELILSSSPETKIVLVVTALGGLLGGIVGLMLAVPFWVIATTGIARLRSAGLVEQAADRAQPALQQLLD